MITWGIILFGVTLTVDLVTDYRRYLKGRTVNHGLHGVALRCIGLVPAGAAFCLTRDFVPLWGLIVPTVGMTGLTYWAIFNNLWGLLKERNIWYLGHSAGLDLFERAHPWVTPMKYLGATASIITYITLYP